MSIELHSSCCDICQANKYNYKVYYKKITSDTDEPEEFYYDENKNIHYHIKKNTHYYSCYCSNDHTWNEYPINKCPSCNWQSTETFKKWNHNTKTNECDEHSQDEKSDIFFVWIMIYFLL